jgi:hypothetical protein
MPSFERCEYFSASGSIPAVVLYRTEQFTFVRFRTADWAGYDGFSNYVTAAIFAKHLRPAAEQRPPGTEALASHPPTMQKWVVSQAAIEQAPLQSTTPPCRSQQQPREPASSATPGGSEAGRAGVLESEAGKEVYAAVKFPSRSPTRIRQIGGLSLRDFIGR